MTPSLNTTFGDRIKLPFTFDVDKIMEEIEQMDLKDFIYYDPLPLRSPAHMVDTSLPQPPPVGDFADGSWTPWMDTPYLDASPYLKSIVDTFREHTKVTLVRLLRLAPGGVVKEHTDPTLGLEQRKSVIRLTIPILNNDQTEFYLNDELVPMKPGECWYMRLSDPHRVINGGTTDRINMSIDMIPNTWLKNLIANSQDN